jgi:hypothetical protein
MDLDISGSDYSIDATSPSKLFGIVVSLKRKFQSRTPLFTHCLLHGLTKQASQKFIVIFLTARNITTRKIGKAQGRSTRDL